MAAAPSSRRRKQCPLHYSTGDQTIAASLPAPLQHRRQQHRHPDLSRLRQQRPHHCSIIDVALPEAVPVPSHRRRTCCAIGGNAPLHCSADKQWSNRGEGSLRQLRPALDSI
ncbi:hypothetical protein ZWY2020_041575 [Hordeum vulgare]|nr:hypothetical protein ZWY2020_041575 [Hordeum vulgare]